jgi:RNA:NAD 2'-phosphotransferase (TPT1/KptA family)
LTSVTNAVKIITWKPSKLKTGSGEINFYNGTYFSMADKNVKATFDFMLSTKQLTSISKFISLVLRHKPETIGLTLDPSGGPVQQSLLIK